VAKKTTKKPKPLAARLAASPALVKKYQSDPGLRSKYLKGDLEKYLNPAQKKARALNVRLSAPIAAGSSTTERDLAHEAQAATTVKYGPQDRKIAEQLGISQQTEKDTGAFYDQYRQALQQHAQNVALYQAGAQQALANTAQGITGLGNQEAVQLQSQANQAAAQQGIAPAGDLSALANAAQATRQGVMASFQNQQALQGAAANTYADAQANTVAPGQRLSALAQARGKTRDIQQKQADLATEKGAYDVQYRADRRTSELKNQIALGALGLNTAKAKADAAANTPEAKAATTAATSAASTAAKYGYTPHQWALLGPKGRQRVINASKAQGKSSPDMGKVNSYGYTEAQWRAMSTSQRQKVIKDFKASTAKGSKTKDVLPATKDARDFYNKYGVQPLSTQQHNTTRDQIGQAQRALKLVGTKDKNNKAITTDAIVNAMATGGTKGIPKLPAVVVRAALDVIRYGGVTNGTADRLHKAGYSVAKLGLKPGKPKPAYKPPASGPAAQIPGVGGN